MEKVRLGDICDLQNGYAFKSKDYIEYSNTVNCRMSNIRPDAKFDINYNIKFLPDDFAKKYKEFLLKDGDIVIAMTDLASNPKILGVPAEVETKGKNVLLNQRVGKIIIKDKEKINFEYLRYSLSNPLNKEYYKKFAGGGLQINISKKDILNIKITIYDVKKQNEIVHKLNKVQEIIDIRKKQIEELDELIKSQFVEMFENGQYNEARLNDISIIKGEYGSGASAGEYIKGQPRYVRITDIQEDGRLNDNSWASPRNEKNIAKYVLKYGDILFARTGATVGKTYKYSEKDGYCIYAGYCIRFRLDMQKANPDYIYIFTKTNKYKKWVEHKQRIVAQPNINAKEYGNDLLIPIPPIELQNQFSEFVKLIDKQKSEIQKSLEEMQKLLESLMEKYFN